jgi:hypothetical protein
MSICKVAGCIRAFHHVAKYLKNNAVFIFSKLERIRAGLEGGPVP